VTGQTEPGLVALYDIRPGNRARLFLQTISLIASLRPESQIANDMQLNLK